MAYIGNNPISAAFLTDTFSGTGSQTAFTMTIAPANTSSIIVAVTGVLQDPSTYSVSGTTLTFSAAPPSGTSNISVRYLGIPASGVTTTAYRTVTNFTATAGQTSFTTPSYTVGYINVFRNGVYLPTTDYTATTGTTVVLANAATAGDTITTESFYVSSVLNAIPATAGSVAASYLAGGAALSNIGSGGITQTYLATGVAGTGPAFSAYRSGSNQNVSTGTWTKAQLNTEDFDTANCFDSVTNYRFTPTVAGYYQINGSITPDSSSAFGNGIFVAIYKNGSIYRVGSSYNTSASVVSTPSVSAVVYFNGSTDYVELYGQFVGGSGMQFSTNNNSTAMSGYLARSA
jgi:hypothetical protein